METRIPPDLIDMLRQRRVIPFIGAGFSAPLGLPDWDQLLRQVCLEMTDIPSYEEIKRCCNNDYLQIAEYLFIKSDRSIGPLRHKLSTLLQPSTNPLESACHVELVNLNPQQIYTTNYDEAIEQTYRALDHPYSFVALPKHIAGSNKGKTQIVKYHGDLRYDQTLVLTESSYYNRLEFESPMDLKFRSDLLGQSVLFIGYSFRDINIRIIWFKLMEMMRDVPESDRPTSYIVRFEKNDILDALYRAVGIRTICLDPEGKASNTDERTNILSRFMLDLSTNMNAESTLPQTATPMFMSSGLISSIRAAFQLRQPPRPRPNDGSRSLIDHAARRQIPARFLRDVDQIFEAAARSTTRNDLSGAFARWAIDHLNKVSVDAPGACFCIIRGLLRAPAREEILDDDAPPVPWSKVWATRLSNENLESLARRIENEAESQREYGADEDTAYAAEIATRILNGAIKCDNATEHYLSIKDSLDKIIQNIGSARNIKTSTDGPPELETVLAEIHAQTEINEDAAPF